MRHTSNKHAEWICICVVRFSQECKFCSWHIASYSCLRACFLQQIMQDCSVEKKSNSHRISEKIKKWNNTSRSGVSELICWHYRGCLAFLSFQESKMPICFVFFCSRELFKSNTIMVLNWLLWSATSSLTSHTIYYFSLRKHLLFAFWNTFLYFPSKRNWHPCQEFEFEQFSIS